MTVIDNMKQKTKPKPKVEYRLDGTIEKRDEGYVFVPTTPRPKKEIKLIPYWTQYEN